MRLLKNNKGLTLIELLIVIAVIGVLAAMILIAINPLEQLARGRDAGRKSSVGQLGNAVQAYYTSRSVFPTVAEWTNSNATNVIVTSGEIRSIPSGSAYSLGAVSPCTTVPIGSGTAQWCYAVNATPDAVVYARMESNSENSRCATPAVAYFVFSTFDSRGGLVCNATEPVAGNQTFVQ